MSPFVVYSLPRSRTFWLSRFLTYGDWSCEHDELRKMRSLADIKTWLGLPNVGTVETSAAPWWRLVEKWRPDAKIVVIRRPVGEVVDSLMRLDLGFDRDAMTAAVVKADAKLSQIARRVSRALVVDYRGLGSETVCGAIFEHCLGLKHDPAWWNALAPVNLQASMRDMVRYCGAFKPQLDRLAAQATRECLVDMTLRRPVVHEALTLQEDTLDDFLRDGQSAFADHALKVDEHPRSFETKNIPLLRKLESLGNLQILTARSNGRVFGYLMTLIAPSIESTETITAIHNLSYASSEFRGLGLKLQREAARRLRDKGVHTLTMRAGVRGDGMRISALYRRMGAVETGQLYELSLSGT